MEWKEKRHHITWTKENYDDIKICHMDTKHIINCINLIDKNPIYEWRKEYKRLFLIELKYRKIQKIKDKLK